MCRLKSVLVLLLLICSKYGCAQDLFFEKITGQEFNPITSIHAIAKDSIGYMWFGSWNGAYRYDGQSFELFYHDDTDKASLPNNRIRNIISDQKLGLWILTFDGQYVNFKYNKEQFETIPQDEVPSLILHKLNKSLKAPEPNRIINNQIYYVTNHNFTSVDVLTSTIYTYKANINQPGALQDDRVTSHFIDDEDIIWVATSNGDIYRANPYRNPFELNYVYSDRSKEKQLLAVRALLKVNQEIWLGTDEGIKVLDKRGNLKKVSNSFIQNSTIKYVRTLFKDHFGRVWIGGVKGLEVYDPDKDIITTILSKGTFDNLEITSVFALEHIDERYLWVGLFNGVARVNLSSNKIDYFEFDEEIGETSVTDILFIDDTHLILATEGSEVIPLKINTDYVPTVDIKMSKSFSNNLSGKLVYALHRDRNGNLWIGTSEGLDRVTFEENEVRIETIKLGQKSPVTYISSITADSSGNIWIAHKSGISMISAHNGRIANFQKQDRYSSWSFWERAFYNDEKDDRIYFGTKNGYLAFDASLIKTDIKAYEKVTLQSLFLGNERIKPQDSIRGNVILENTLASTQRLILDSENRNFSIEYTSFNYDNSLDLQYHYTLEGYDDGWNTTSETRVSYNKVPPGNYEFLIYNDQFNEIQGATTRLPITILAPWYARPIAKISFATILILIFIVLGRELIYRTRLKNQVRLERVNREQQAKLAKDKLDFFTNVSHELKTPLTLIADPLKQLQKNNLNKRDKTMYLSLVDRNVNNLSRLINQILDFRKTEEGAIKPRYSNTDLKRLIISCFQSFKLLAAKRNINFTVDIDEAIGECLIDIEKTEQIFMNILSNAFKYTPDGGHVKWNICLIEQGTLLNMSIADTGIGISKHALETIFSPFNSSNSRPFHGNSSGIGLSLTRNLVEVLGGSIELESKLELGTQVYIKLPYRKSNSITIKSEQKIADDHILKSSEFDSKPHILIVEDNEDVQAYLKNELEKHFNVSQAFNGKDGLDQAIASIPDLIISDIMMPVMEGVSMSKVLKQNQNTCHIPILLLTAKTSEESKMEGYKHGVEGYITKPFSVDVLQAQVKSVLHNRKILQQTLAQKKSIGSLLDSQSKLDSSFLKKITKFVNEELNNPELNSDLIAQHMHISQRQLYRKLKAITGNTVNEFMLRVKMEQAEILLKTSSLNISEIAYKVGYNEPSNFSRSFSKFYGCSPTAYRSKV